MSFDIPVAIFFFKRTEKVLEVINRISRVRPSKMYLISDGPRNSVEKAQVENCRSAVEKAIQWPCEIVKNYAERNEGIYDRIGNGARWVLTNEECAIFLEDDNLPEESFFPYCAELLERYRDDERVLWVCGTNYLGDFQTSNRASYVFTKHMLPCGWASWSSKFTKFYDGDLSLLNDAFVRDNLRFQYTATALFRQQSYVLMSEYERISTGKRPRSWDYQMALSLRANSLFGIAPAKNQILNIGVDVDSTHGGNSYLNPMTRRLCGMGSYPLSFPLEHPKSLLPDQRFEEEIARILTMPLWMEFGMRASKMLRRMFSISDDVSMSRLFSGALERLAALSVRGERFRRGYRGRR